MAKLVLAARSAIVTHVITFSLSHGEQKGIMHKTINFKVAVLLQQKTTSDSTPMSQEQELVGKDLLKLDS